MLSSSAALAASAASEVRSSLRAAKSVSQLTSASAAAAGESATETHPSAALREAFLAAAASPRFLRAEKAASVVGMGGRGKSKRVAKGEREKEVDAQREAADNWNRKKQSTRCKSASSPLPSFHSASTRAALTSVTGAPDFSRRALISWSWFEGAAEAAAEAKDRRCRRRSACSSVSASRNDDELELEIERRKSKLKLLPSLEKEQELEARLSVRARAAARAPRAREERLIGVGFSKFSQSEKGESDLVFFLLLPLYCCSLFNRLFLLFSRASLDALAAAPPRGGTRLDALRILESA